MTLEPLVAPREAVDGSRRRLLLTGHPVLSFLAAQEFEPVLGFVIARRRGAGNVIFRKGDGGKSMMLIAVGRVKVSPTGRDDVLERPGDLAELVDS